MQNPSNPPPQPLSQMTNLFASLLDGYTINKIAIFNTKLPTYKTSSFKMNYWNFILDTTSALTILPDARGSALYRVR